MVPSLREQRQESQEFGASLGYSEIPSQNSKTKATPIVVIPGSRTD